MQESGAGIRDELDRQSLSMLVQQRLHHLALCSPERWRQGKQEFQGPA
jgi:hypothetical protein